MTTAIASMPARQMSMGLALSWQAAQDPNRPALTCGEQSYTRLELDRACNRLARALAAHGVGKDDRVIVVLPTGPKHQITCFALWKLGAMVIPLPPKLVDVEIRELAARAEPKLVIGVECARLPGHATLPQDFEPDSTLSSEPLPEVVATIWKASTSGGSTGTPKLLFEKRSSLVHPLQTSQLLRMKVNDVVCHPGGAYHNSAFSQTAWALCWGAHVILMARFDALGWLQLVERHRVRWAYLVPTMMSRILKLGDRKNFDLSSLEVVMHMAAPCPPWVKEGWIEWIGAEKIWEIYAGTEGYGASMISGTEWLAHRGSVGRASPDLTIRDEAGQSLPAGQVGTIYYHPGADNLFGHPDMALTYGDMGWVDADGYLYIADRRTDMILTGGGNLYPAVMESAIEQFPGVLSAAVIGLPDPDLGAKAHAIIELPAGHPAPEPEALAAFLATRLSRRDIPYTCEFVVEALRDEAGKVRRQRLREQRLTGAAQATRYPLR